VRVVINFCVLVFFLFIIAVDMAQPCCWLLLVITILQSTILLGLVINNNNNELNSNNDNSDEDSMIRINEVPVSNFFNDLILLKNTLCINN
jgi:hypothetical protein